ncbi:Panacea domain-containing protein [Xylanibacter muris]|uniref:Panacea domain-containing protein n=1 Tax=Xylanibacter muris TaxID=2736290 RepID=UPI000FFE37CA|nr:type II toxin-antitoxin system antitoxin SocA domain-containing protein [Xylanibacter muris]MDE5658285.1 DUF4065 domain-containing protein [Muribaculaceae bacterium]RXE71763.1 DUF4065 domain-containing protein [Muribaculaceae bacterium Isolate-002 (NCI)]
MESVFKFANYIVSRYINNYGVSIDEMKLHKLLYFAQREALIQLGKPLFGESFYAWKYGPVLVAVRDHIKFFGPILPQVGYCINNEYVPVFDKVFSQYAGKDSWSLSRLSHGEFSWQNARKGLGPIDSCDKAMSIDDIKIDANRIKLRRYFLSQIRNQSK